MRDKIIKIKYTCIYGQKNHYIKEASKSDNLIMSWLQQIKYTEMYL